MKRAISRYVNCGIIESRVGVRLEGFNCLAWFDWVGKVVAWGEAKIEENMQKGTQLGQRRRENLFPNQSGP
jgi:hypothetical protein